MKRFKVIASLIIAGVLGIIVGAFLFSGVQRRSFLSFTDCTNGQCTRLNDLAGLMASVGFQKIPNLAPRVVKETDKSVAVEYQKGWYVVFPKKDIKDAAELRDDDRAYLDDAYAIMGGLVREQHMTNWQIVTNGPDIQHMRYLHFHLIDNDKQ